jgi:hypothetical protein
LTKDHFLGCVGSFFGSMSAVGRTKQLFGLDRRACWHGDCRLAPAARNRRKKGGSVLVCVRAQERVTPDLAAGPRLFFWKNSEGARR